jgi:hypothetical protein
MSNRFRRKLRLAAVPLLLAALGAGPALAAPQSGSNNDNPLSSQTPPPNAPVQSGPGTTASDRGVNTAAQTPALVRKRPVTEENQPGGTNTEGQADTLSKGDGAHNGESVNHQ